MSSGFTAQYAILFLVIKKLCKTTQHKVITSTFRGERLIGFKSTRKRFAKMPNAFSTIRLAVESL
jgi:hypothetical protein